MQAPARSVAALGALAKSRLHLHRAKASEAASSAQSSTAAVSSGGRSGTAGKLVGTTAVLAGAGGTAYAWQTGLLDELYKPPSSVTTKQLRAADPPSSSAVSPSSASKQRDPSHATSTSTAPAVDNTKAVEEAAKAQAQAQAAAAAAQAETEAREAQEAAAAKEAAAAAAESAAAHAAAAEEAAQASQQSLAQMEADRIRGIERREAALASLRAALDSDDHETIAEALAAAKSSGLMLCKEIQLAESICAPLKLSSTDIAEEILSEHLLSLPAEFAGLDAAEAEAAERSRCEGLDREQLEARVLELTKLLAIARLHAGARVDQALLTQLEKVDAASLQSLGEALSSADLEYERQATEEYSQLQARLAREQQEALDEAIAAANANAQAQLVAEKEQLLTAAHEARLEAAADRLPEVLALSSGLTSLENVLREDDAVVHRAHAYNCLSAALLRLEEAVLADRTAHTELEALRKAAEQVNDSFVVQLLASLPADSAELCRRAAPVPTEPSLRQSLNSKLGELAATAFVPPNSGLMGELLGRAFRSVYVLGAEGLQASSDATPAAPAAAAASNLASLGRVQRAAENCSGESLREAVALLEGNLRGLCAERASAAWLEEAKATLALRQTLKAVKARVQCLNETLL